MNDNEQPQEFEAELPLAPPPPPMILRNTALRIALRPPEGEVLALEVEMDGEMLAHVGARLHAGRIEMALTSGFGASRMIQLSPAELLALHQFIATFIQELPR